MYIFPEVNIYIYMYMFPLLQISCFAIMDHIFNKYILKVYGVCECVKAKVGGVVCARMPTHGGVGGRGTNQRKDDPGQLQRQPG